MDLSIEGNSTAIMEVQPKKVLSPINVIVSGNLISVNDVQPSKAEPSIPLSLDELENITVINEEQSLKALDHISSSVDGNFTDIIEGQSLKALNLISTMDSGNSTEFKEIQDLNASIPIAVTV